MTHNKFIDIERIRDDNVSGFEKGDHICIQEKIDGANAAVRYDPETDSVIAQSRRNILDSKNDLRGFLQWSQTLDKELLRSVLGEDLIAYCEWLVPHTVRYPEECYDRAYFYDVYDTASQEYLPQDKAKEIFAQLGFTYVPVFYEGEFVSWEHCMGFVGRTALGGEYGEGIVVKNQTKLNDPDESRPFYVKIVDEKFKETKSVRVRLTDSERLRTMAEDKALAETIVTEARVVKLLHKFVDDGILPENWGAAEMPVISKNLTKAVYEDCIKEEPDIAAQINNFGKVANGIAMRIARRIMEER